MGSHYEISPRERDDEMRRHYDEFDAPQETYDEYLQRTTTFGARVSGLSKAEPQAGLQLKPNHGKPGTGSPQTPANESEAA